MSKKLTATAKNFLTYIYQNIYILIMNIKETLYKLKNFEPDLNANYLNDYNDIVKVLKENKDSNTKIRSVVRSLCEYDLFFLGYFVLNIEPLNRAWIIERIREVAYGAQTDTLELWAREHFKSTIFTLLEPIQKKLRFFSDGSEVPHYSPVLIKNLKQNPNKSFDIKTGIFSFNKTIASSFLSVIKSHLEDNDTLKWLYPDILYDKPKTQSPKWTTDKLELKRKGKYKESCFEAWGLVDTMPTGRHFNHMVKDDIVTMANVHTKESNDKVYKSIEMASNLGSSTLPEEYNTNRTIGTFYRHNDPYVKLSEQKNADGTPAYIVRKFPATEDGKWNGKPVLLSQKQLDRRKLSPATYATQQLLDPSYRPDAAMKGNSLIDINPIHIPKKDMHYFITIDSAGDDDVTQKAGDDWAITLFGVSSEIDEEGLNEVYILDIILAPLSLTKALTLITKMYLSRPRIHKLSLELQNGSFLNTLVVNRLRSKRISLSEERGNFKIIKQGARNKEKRITTALETPLEKGKIQISTDIDEKIREKIKKQLDDFPFGANDDALDGISQLYDVLKDYTFSVRKTHYEKKRIQHYKEMRDYQEESSKKLVGWLIR